MHARPAALCGAIVMLAGLGLPLSPPASASTPASARSCAGWRSVASPATGTLNAVAATSARNAWAVGTYSTGTAYRSLIEHWNGSRWSAVPSPDPASGADTTNALTAVVALSPTNAWAFGFYEKRNTNFRTLVVHWNGSRWSVVPSPNSGPGENTLAAATAVSPADIWAVGYHGDPGHRRTLTEHWNGSAWSVVPSPSIGQHDSFLFGAAAAPGGRIWAVGTSPPDFNQTFAMTWTGSAWSVTPTPNPGVGDRFLQAVAAPTAASALAVGSYVRGRQTRTLAERWTGSAWSLVGSPSPGPDYNSLQAVAATGQASAWAVGASRHDLGARFRALAEHWNGASWVTAPIPSPGRGDDWLFGIAAVPHRGGYWAVGSAGRGTLIEFRC